MRSLYVVEEKVHYGLSRYTDMACDREAAGISTSILAAAS